MEKKDLKVGNIVVVKEGNSSGNKPDTITKITSLCKNDKVREYSPLITCEAISHFGSRQFNPDCKTKIPSWFEDVADVRLATPEEKKVYAAAKKARAIV
jgi:hypothetical protein